MSRRRPHLLAVRSVAALGVAAALCGASAGASHALGLPEPVSTAVGGIGSTVTGVTGGLGLPVPGASPTTPTGTATSAGPSSPAPGSAGTSPTTQPSATSAGTRGTRAPATSPTGSPGGAVVDSPAATACLIPTGGASPAVRLDLRAAGVDLSSPLVRQFPQALAPCPADAVPAGDHVLSVDAAVKGLLGACVRVTRQVVPVQTSLVVLDRDLITELTEAGVPLDRLVVACPKGAAAPPAGSTPSAPSAPGHADASSPGPSANSSLPAGLAFTGSDSVPMAMIGAGLLWLGVLLTRRARAASVRSGAARG